MDLNDVTPVNFFKKVTFASDPSPGNKLVLSNDAFIECAILLLIAEEIRKK